MLYKIAVVICKGILKLIFNVNVKGDSSLCSVEGCIVYANHTCYLDPVVMGSFTKRQIRFMAKKELYKNGFFRYILLRLGTVPVRRGKADISAVKASLELLRSGEILGMFPEGTRNKSGRPMDAEPGLAMLAIRARVPVVPIAIMAEYKAFGRVTVVIGEPIYLKEYYNERLTMDHYKEISNYLMGSIFNMLNELEGKPL